MNADGTKVEAFDTVINFGKEYPNEHKAIIEKAAKTCPVGNSLSTDIKRTFQFNYWKLQMHKIIRVLQILCRTLL